MNNLEIQVQKAVKAVEEKMNMKIQVKVSINNRLSRTLGWYQYYTKRVDGQKVFGRPCKIEISGKLKEEHTYEIVAHEAAHYFTSLTHGLHEHDHPEFIRICNFLETSPEPTAPSNYAKEVEKKLPRYECSCSNMECGAKFRSYSSANAKVVKLKGRGCTCSACGSQIRVYDNKTKEYLRPVRDAWFG